MKPYQIERRNHILESAFIVFSKNGYTNSTMADIISEASISRGGLYAYFRNIDELFIEVLRMDDHRNYEILKFDKSYFNTLTNWLLEIKKSIKEETTLAKAKSEFFLIHNSLEIEYLKERHEQLSNSIQSHLQDGISSLEYKAVNTLYLSELIISTVNGMMIDDYYRHSKIVNYDDLFKEFINHLEFLLLKENTNV